MAESIIIYRKDGTPVDISAYVSNMQINRGDVTGFGEAGFEGVAHTLSLTLNNSKEINFSPFSEKGENISEYVNITGNGSKIYTASATNIYPETVMTDTEGLQVWLTGTNFVFSRALKVGETARVMYTRYDLTAYNPINRYNNAFNPLLDEMAAIEVFENDTAIQSKRVTLVGNGTKRITVTDNILAETLMVENGSCGATYIPASDEIEFSTIIPIGTTINVLYSYQAGEKSCIFSGYVGNSISISEDNSQINLTCSDKTYRLQKAYIDNVQYNIVRNYAVEKVYAEELIQNTLNDIFGAGEITLFTPVASGQLIEITSNEWGGKSVWDMIQGIASAIGWVIWYKYNSTTGNFELTFQSVPRNKTAADYTLDYKENLLSLPVEMSGTEIYNQMLLYYTDSTTGTVKYVSAENAASVNSYGGRVGIVKEGQTLGINNEAQAQILANDIVSDISEKVVTGTITIPLDTKYEFFDIVAINYPKLSNLVEYFVVESIQHTWDYASQKFETVIAGNKQKVRGGNLRWTSKITRPSKMEQITNRDVGTASLMKKPSNLTVIESGIEKLSLASQAFAILSWTRPLGEYPGRYELEIKKQADNWTKAEKYSIIPSEIAGSSILSQRVVLSTNTAYHWRVTAIDTSGKRGEVSDNAQINSIGDNVAPATVTGLSVTAGVKQLVIKFNPSTETDFLKYRIYYYKTGETPVYKETASTVTTIDNLDTVLHNVYVTAIDTSGNESIPTSTFTATPTLVNDDIFAEIRDKTLHIKTNAQMQQWVNSLNNVTTSSPTFTDISSLYNTVKLYNINYTLTRGIALSCADEFNIEGVGSSAITFNNLNTLNGIRIKSKKLNWKNLNLKKTAGVSAFDGVVLNAYSDLDLFLVNIENSSFSNDSGLSFGFRCNNANFGTTNLNVKSIEMENFNFTAYVLNPSEFINSNLSVVTSKIKNNAILIVEGTWNNINIADNQFVSGRLALDSISTTNSGKIINNFFRKSFGYSANPQCFLNFEKANLKQMFICQNSFSAYRLGTTLTLRDVYIARLNGTDAGNPAEFKYSQFCNNVIFSEEISTITPVANIYLEGINTDTTGTIIANNTNN